MNANQFPINKVLDINNMRYESDAATWCFLLCKREYPTDWPRHQRNHIYLSITEHPTPRIAYEDVHMGYFHDLHPHEFFDFTNTRAVFNSIIALHQELLQAHAITVDPESLQPVDTLDLPNDLLEISI